MSTEKRVRTWACIAPALLCAPQILASPGDALATVPMAYAAPRDLATASDGSLWVADPGADAVVHLSADGTTVLAEINTATIASCETPTGVTHAAGSTLAILDSASRIIHRRNLDGTPTASTPEISLAGLGLVAPVGLDVMPTGEWVTVDGTTVFLIAADGSAVASSFSTEPLLLFSPSGVAVAADGTLWISDSAVTGLVHATAAGSSLGVCDVAPLGIASPAGLDVAPDGTLWTIDGDSDTLHHHSTGAAPVGSPASIVFPERVGLNPTVGGLTRDFANRFWVLDPKADRVHRLTPDTRSIEFSFDVSAWPDVEELDVGLDGHFYLTDPSLGVVHILAPDGATQVGSLTAAGMGVLAINSLAIDPDGSLWFIDPFLYTVYHRSIDGTVDLGGFALPLGIWGPRDIEVAPDGTLWVVNANLGSSTLEHLHRDGTPGAPIATFAVGASLGIDEPESVALLESGDVVVSDLSQSRLVTIEGPPPVIARAIHVDVASPLGVSVGDQLVLVFDQPVVLGPGSFETDDFTLTAPGDSLGTYTAAANPQNPTQIILTLGAGASLTIPGSGVGSSAIDIAFTAEGDEILDAQTGTPVSPSSPRDIQFTLVPSGATTVTPAGGTVSVVDTADAVYRHHTLAIPAGALDEPTAISLSVPSLATGLVNAVEVSPAALTLAIPASLTMEYTDNDLLSGPGGDEEAMRIHQVFDLAGVLTAAPLPGLQTVDTAANSVTATLSSFDPFATGGPVIFAVLPLDTIDDRSITIRREETGGPAGAATASSAVPTAVLTVGSEGTYTRHQIAFPGYVEAPEGIRVTIRDANIFDRFGFPASSGAIYVLEASEPIDTPIEVTVEFRPDPAQGDIVRLDGTPGHPLQMRLVRRPSFGQPFTFVADGEASVVIPTVTTTGVLPTLAQGLTVYGVAADPTQIPAELTLFTAD